MLKQPTVRFRTKRHEFHKAISARYVAYLFPVHSEIFNFVVHAVANMFKYSVWQNCNLLPYKIFRLCEYLAKIIKMREQPMTQLCIYYNTTFFRTLTQRLLFLLDSRDGYDLDQTCSTLFKKRHKILIPNDAW